MRLAINVTINLHVTRPTAPRFHIFFQGKRVSHQPPQIPCVFSSKTRLAFNAEHPHIPCFFKANAHRRNPAAFVVFTFLVFTFLVFFQAIRILHSEVIVNLHVMRPTATWFLIFSSREMRLAGGIPGVKLLLLQVFIPTQARKKGKS